MSAETLERSVLEGKDREQLIAIATALGLKALSRAKKGEIIDRILEQTGAAPAAGTLGSSNGNGSGGVNGAAPAAADPPAAEADASPSDLPTGPVHCGPGRARRRAAGRLGAGHRRRRRHGC